MIVTFPPIANALALITSICASLGILVATLRLQKGPSRSRGVVSRTPRGR